MSPSATPKTVPCVKASAGAQHIVDLMHEYGGVIIKGFLTPQQVQQLNSNIDEPLERIQQGSLNDNDELKKFHGAQTKRLTNLVTYSKVFREEILDQDLVHDISGIVFAEDQKAYWMSAAQAIQIQPGNVAQQLHRDQSQFRIFDLMGPEGPEAVVNFLIALTEFTEENGATRVIPGSHKWEDFTDLGAEEDTLPALMQPGDCFFMSGKTVHGGGANKTASEARRGLALAISASYLTPEEAYTFQIDIELARTMSKRAQHHSIRQTLEACGSVTTLK
ncbi:hypothetical protein LTR67_008400 [Exophiala xenobiotica]